ncbi:23S rRNA (pseudouridine(1915)-N(3))-methyltransferase RlmH [Haliangium sp.]|uniref:23S rRNA (pseudouridine(1915)-N(3))-methyltransferase RlmH n=1 Tax=Haliangium sp. TaxID=2663208 RepID=UPI003D1429E6
MKISLYVCGRLKEPYLQAAENEYLKRLRPYCKLDVREHRSDQALLSAIPDDAHLYAFDERGDDLSSPEFSALLGREEQFGAGAPVVFAIGGADGHSPALRRRARALLAFGRMTIAHRLVRILVLEQIYRGYRILRGEPYHRT